MTTTIHDAQFSALLDRLFQQADQAASPDFGTLTSEERERLLHSKTEYLSLYQLLKGAWLPVSRETGTLLYMLARSIRATAIVEFGTSFGLSTLHLAAALRDNGGGRLITTEFEPSKVNQARAHLAEGSVEKLVEVREGDALTTLASDLPESIDLVLLDGAKALYNEVLDLLESRLRPGAIIIADNADFSPEYLARVRHPHGGYLSVPFADDVELSIRLA
ncbi:O-methyltransferase [Chitinimonas sp.]|uniref:O-methyltransferase n=1 Tax=Chitinimonas sp. TaxID=1934313 RepID=UPI0035B0AF84